MSDTLLVAAETGETLSIGQITIRVLEDGTRTDNRLGAVEISVPAGVAGPPMHFHKMHDETLLMLRGTMRFTTNVAQLDAKVGDYVVVPVDAPHTFANISDAPAAFFNSFTPAYYVQYLRELSALFRSGSFTPEAISTAMSRYATVPSKP